jgi:ATP-binding cassette subfamily B protein
VVLLRAAPRAYFLVSLVAVFLVLVATPTQEALALVLGGISLGMVTLGSLCDVVLSGGELYAQWKTIAPVVRDAEPVEGGARLATVDVPRGDKIIELRSVRFAYPNRDRAVLESANVVIRQGDRVLIEGGSGGGKTTLTSLLAGLRKPSSGLVLVKGVDHHTISELELRKAIASAPQFYKNHVFTGSLAWNLLLGRHWPPSTEDLREARSVCEDLGLGPLVDRMPGGLFQQVGETGWQLSHGERSRVFLARTLLQGADVVLLDETFGALDPATLEQCMAACLRRSPTLMVITHR